MHRYPIFGGILRSDLEFPELPVADGTSSSPRWTLRRDDDLPPTPPDAVPTATEQVQAGVGVSLHVLGDDWRLTYDDTGMFDVSPDGREIAWRPPSPFPDTDAVRQDVLGRVLALALHRGGVASLHGSAVVLGGSALAFLAPRGCGKSTTAMALVGPGASLLADDTVAVACGGDVRALPGVPSARLRPDAAARVAPGDVPRGPSTGAKLRTRPAGRGHVPAGGAPLDAIYLLRPVLPDDPDGPERVRIGGRTSALALLGQAKIGGLLGAEAVPGLLARMDEIASRVPIYGLRVPRDLDRLPDVADALESWHAQEVPAAAAAGAG